MKIADVPPVVSPMLKSRVWVEGMEECLNRLWVGCDNPFFFRGEWRGGSCFLMAGWLIKVSAGDDRQRDVLCAGYLRESVFGSNDISR